MAKKKITEPKPRAEKYGIKVKFDGSLEDMIKMASKGKPKDEKKE